MANPYTDYSPSGNDAVVDTTDVTAQIVNRQRETQRYIKYPKVLDISNVKNQEVLLPYVVKAWNRGSVQADQQQIKSFNDQVFLVKNTAQFLDACKVGANDAIEWREIIGLPGTVINQDVGIEIPSRTKISNIIFNTDLTARGIYDAALANGAPGGAVEVSTPLLQDIRIGDLVFFRETTFTSGSNWRRITDELRSTSDGFEVNGDLTGLTIGEDVLVLKSDIIFEGCTFYGTLNLDYTYHCKVRDCLFWNDDFNDYSGKLDLTVSTANEFELFFPLIENCRFVIDASDLNAVIIDFDGRVAGPRLLNCWVYATQDLTGATSNAIGWPGGGMAKGGIMWGNHWGHADNDMQIKDVLTTVPAWFFTLENLLNITNDTIT